MSVLLKSYWPQVMAFLFHCVVPLGHQCTAICGTGFGGCWWYWRGAKRCAEPFEWQKVSMVLVSIFAVVIVAEAVVIHIRNKLI